MSAEGLRERALVREARRTFRHSFGGEPDDVAVAPWRVNLIGEHTDYNDGFVLPMAIDRGVAVAFAPRADRKVRVHATLVGETHDIMLDGTERRPRTWSSYVAGVMRTMSNAGHSLRAADLAIAGDLPVGAGLSSSAALELAVAQIGRAHV